MVKYYKLVDKERNIENYIELKGDNFAPFYKIVSIVNTFHDTENKLHLLR